MGAIANLAGLVTFLDWAAIKSRAKREKKPLTQSMKSLEELETSLKKIHEAVMEKRDILEVKHFVDVLCHAKTELVNELRELGIEIPEQEPPKVRGLSDEALLTMVSLCQSGISEARTQLT